MDKDWFKPCTYAGKHLLIDVWDVKPELLDNVDFISTLLKNAAIATGATIIGENFHKFSPNGLSGVVLLQESHVSIHTFPEKGYAALDIFTCGDCEPIKAIKILQLGFQTDRINTKYELRGIKC